LRDVNQLLSEKKHEEALQVLASIASRTESSFKRSKIANLVANSQFSLGRYDDALSRFSDAAEFSARDNLFGHSFLEPSLGKIRCLLKMQRSLDASSEARSLLRGVESNWNRYLKLRAVPQDQMLELGALTIPSRPIRIPVALTRVGKTFQQEGYIEEAKLFYERVLSEAPRGASRARQFLANIELQKGNAERAELLAKESLTFGGFKAKTVASWTTYFRARKASGKSAHDAELLASFLGSHLKGRVYQRAASVIVRELRRHNDKHWYALANSFVDGTKGQDPIVKIEMIKLFLSELKAGLLDVDHPHQKALSLVSIALNERSTTYNECIGFAKEVGRYKTKSGMSLPELQYFLQPIRERYGEECWVKAMHSSALGMVEASNYQGAEELFRIVVRTAEAYSNEWSRAVWSLAKVETSLENHASAAKLWLVYVGNKKAKPDFRLQAFFKWIASSEHSGIDIDLRSTKIKIRSLVKDLRGPRPLLDAGRQMILAGPRFESLAEEVIVEAEIRTKKLFDESTMPAEALALLLPLTRKQYYDFRRTGEVVAFYESLSADKLSWLWSKGSFYWEYLSLVMRSYFQEGMKAKGIAIGRMCTDDPTVTDIGRVFIGTHYAEWLVLNGDIRPGIGIFELVASESPTHRLSARALYWMGLFSLVKNNDDEAIQRFRLVRRCLLPRPALLTEWEVDCKSVILIQRLSETQRFGINLDRYNDDFIEKQKLVISDDIRLVSNSLGLGR
jgi:tetratricopeptide (TPR) repeat protein